MNRNVSTLAQGRLQQAEDALKAAGMMKASRESEALLEVRRWKQACYEEIKTMPLREALHFRLTRAAMSARRFQPGICVKPKTRICGTD